MRCWNFFSETKKKRDAELVESNILRWRTLASKIIFDFGDLFFGRINENKPRDRQLSLMERRQLECADLIRRGGKASNLDKMTVGDGWSIGPENRGKTRGKHAENVREIWTIVPARFGMKLGSRYQC